MRPTILFLAVLASAGISPAPLLAGVNQSKLAQVVEGKTTGPQVLALLGEPQARCVNSDGTTAYSYYSGAFPSEWVTILLTPSGLVASVQTFRREVRTWDIAVGMLQALRITRSKQPDSYKWAQVQPGRTTERQLIELVGRPQATAYASTGIRTLSYFYGPLIVRPNVRNVVLDNIGAVLSWTDVSIAAPFVGPSAKEKTKPFDANRWAMIVESKTTEAEVLGLIGRPSASMGNPDGTTTYTYRYASDRTDTSEYSIVLDAAGTVVSTSDTVTTRPKTQDTVLTGVGKNRLVVSGRRIDPARWQAIASGLTTEADVIEICGSPQSKIRNPDGTTAYFYLYAEDAAKGKFLVTLWHYEERHDVVFDKRGVVISTNRPRLDDGLPLRALRPEVLANWVRIGSARAARTDILRLVGEPQHTLPRQGRRETLLYLYYTGASSLRVYAVTFDDQAAVASVSTSETRLLDANALLPIVESVLAEGVAHAGASAADVIARCGEPQHRFLDEDGNQALLYLTGQVKTSTFPSGGQTEERYRLYLFTTDRDGRVLSARRF